jgi:hypothetical protein
MADKKELGITNYEVRNLHYEVFIPYALFPLLNAFSFTIFLLGVGWGMLGRAIRGGRRRRGSRRGAGARERRGGMTSR